MLTLLSGVISTLDEGLKQIQQALAWASATRRWCQTFWRADMAGRAELSSEALSSSGGELWEGVRHRKA